MKAATVLHAPCDTQYSRINALDDLVEQILERLPHRSDERKAELGRLLAS